MRKKSGLIIQHLELIDVGALEKYQNILRDYIKRREGIYALYRKNRLYYIGLAGNLRTRLSAHLKDGHRNKWDRFSIYFTQDTQHLKELESLMLRTILPKPKGNRQSGKFAVSDNLARRFKRDFREYQRKEYGELVGLSAKKHPQEVSPADNELAHHVRRVGKNIQLRAIYKGKIHRAFVQEDGNVRYKNRKYKSASSAGKAITQRACNGWAFWKYEQAPSKWVPISQLRR